MIGRFLHPHLLSQAPSHPDPHRPFALPCASGTSLCCCSCPHSVTSRSKRSHLCAVTWVCLVFLWLLCPEFPSVTEHIIAPLLMSLVPASPPRLTHRPLQKGSPFWVGIETYSPRYVTSTWMTSFLLSAPSSLSATFLSAHWTASSSQYHARASEHSTSKTNSNPSPPALWNWPLLRNSDLQYKLYSSFQEHAFRFVPLTQAVNPSSRPLQ